MHTIFLCWIKSIKFIAGEIPMWFFVWGRLRLMVYVRRDMVTSVWWATLLHQKLICNLHYVLGCYQRLGFDWLIRLGLDNLPPSALSWGLIFVMFRRSIHFHRTCPTSTWLYKFSSLPGLFILKYSNFCVLSRSRWNLHSEQTSLRSFLANCDARVILVEVHLRFLHTFVWTSARRDSTRRKTKTFFNVSTGLIIVWLLCDRIICALIGRSAVHIGRLKLLLNHWNCLYYFGSIFFLLIFLSRFLCNGHH